jgi:hypothetical protein
MVIILLANLSEIAEECGITSGSKKQQPTNLNNRGVATVTTTN